MLPMGCAVSRAGILNKYSHTTLDCWTLVDFDGDGDLDIVRAVPDDGAAYKTRKVEYFEQATWQHTCCGNPWKTVGIV